MCWASGELIPRHDDKLQTLSEFSEAANRRENNTYYTTSTRLNLKVQLANISKLRKLHELQTFFFVFLLFRVDVMLSSQ